MQKLNEEYINNLCDAVISINDKEECKKFLLDLFTFQELESTAQRLEVAKQLREGKSYNEINQQTGASTATISRVNKCLNYGDGGYAQILEKMGK